MANKVFFGELPGASTSPRPAMEFFPPEGTRAGLCMVIFPGGGYGHLAGHEGRGYAEFFAANGIACLVVEYRLAKDRHSHPAMLEDALAAVRAARGLALELGYSDGRVGVVGSSAGGHLAAHAMVSGERHQADSGTRPDFGVLCYPVVTMTEACCHLGSRDALLGGRQASPELLAELSPETRVSADTPPCFIWHTLEDSGVPAENSLLYAAALRAHGVPHELHLYQKGRHGLGLATEFNWGGECLRWLDGLFDGAAELPGGNG